MAAPASNIGFAGKRGQGWALLARWLVPSMMLLAYAFMAATAETDSTGQAWLALGFAFVLVLWFVVRFLTSSAAVSRALAVGDADRIFEIAGRELAGRTGKSRGKWLYAIAFAHETRGSWDDALEWSGKAAEAGVQGDLVAKLAAVRVAALVELGRAAEAREVFAASLASAKGFELDSLARVSDARIAWAEKTPEAASPLLKRVIDDIRAGSFTRATAHGYAARIADARGDVTAAMKHRVEISKLAPRSWLGSIS